MNLKKPMKYFFKVLLILLLTSCSSKNKDKTKQHHMSDFQKALAAYPSIDSISKHQVLTLGVFHFDRSRDGSDVIANEHIDISTDSNQKELDSLINLLEQFNPGKIAVEWRTSNQEWMDSLYTEYQKGNYKLGKHETFQLGFKLAKALGHSRVYCIDNNPPFPEYINAIDDWGVYADSLGHLELWKAYDAENKRYNTFMDTIQRHLNVYDYIKLINSKQHSKRSKQLWTTGLVNVDHGSNYLGADAVGRWYRRNVRLFANSKNLVSKNENLLIIYGGAHKWILDELFESAPDFRVMTFNDLTKH
ncbi:DUF5694 domain-containing protein [Aquimarina macrocephali]|uniref:DUF5694 domain-containing protein n=1 Tax=Aquimarina macrocephali TaxID=666563 RepID=UPI000467E02D|nr:DUF5694 domain-containing protein [Aquimarina macrocephali]